MQWHLQKYVVKELIEYIRRIFKYESSWTNVDIEVIDLGDIGQNPLAFEQFFEENERYPIITLNAAGSSLSHSAVNNLIQIYDDDSVALGTRALSFVPISSSIQCNVPLPSSVYNETLRGLFVILASDGSGVPGEDITVNLYSHFTTSSVLVATGTIIGTTSGLYDFQYCELPSTPLLDTDYWFTFGTVSGSVYNIAIDPDADGTYQSNQTGSTVTSSGSIVANLLLPAVASLGGMNEGSVIIKCQSKNATAMASDLSELIGQYLELGRVAQFTRASGSINTLKASVLSENNLPTLASKGIHIKAVRLGNVDMRRRGNNDQIFSISVSVDYLAEWSQEFPAEILQDITQDIQYFT
jgi:hypothetical protein